MARVVTMATEAMGAEPEVALADMLTIKIRADVVCSSVPVVSVMLAC